MGGGRRSDASHDADFLVYHPGLIKQSQLKGMLEKIVRWGCIFHAALTPFHAQFIPYKLNPGFRV